VGRTLLVRQRKALQRYIKSEVLLCLKLWTLQYDEIWMKICFEILDGCAAMTRKGYYFSTKTKAQPFEAIVVVCARVAHTTTYYFPRKNTAESSSDS
jgi:hypothetical protein